MVKYTPTFPGFVSWVFDPAGMGVPTEWLSGGSPVLQLSYDLSVETVRLAFACVAPAVYQTMIYNLAAHYLAQFAQDPVPLPDPPFIEIDGVKYGFWSYLRKQSGLNGFTSGLVQASSDEGTSVSLVAPKWADSLTAGQLQLTNSPWGRVYLGFAQDSGTAWGLS